MIRTLRNLNKRHLKVTHLFLKGVVQIRRTLQRGPFCKPSTATMKLYRAPATPTAANAIDKNICRRERTSEVVRDVSVTAYPPPNIFWCP